MRDASGDALDGDRLDDHRIDGSVLTTGWCRGDRVDHRARISICDFAKDGVFEVQPIRLVDGDEELRAVGTGAGIRHREEIRLAEGELGVKLIAELVPRAAGSRAERVSTLNHEATDHAVEGSSVVELGSADLAGIWVPPLATAFGQLDEVRDRLRSVVREELEADRTPVGVQRREELLS